MIAYSQFCAQFYLPKKLSKGISAERVRRRLWPGDDVRCPRRRARRAAAGRQQAGDSGAARHRSARGRGVRQPPCAGGFRRAEADARGPEVGRGELRGRAVQRPPRCGSARFFETHTVSLLFLFEDSHSPAAQSTGPTRTSPRSSRASGGPTPAPGPARPRCTRPGGRAFTSRPSTTSPSR